MNDIRAIRTQLGLTQIEFAERLGLHQSTISRLESGALEIDKRTRLAVQGLVAAVHPSAGSAHEDAASPDDCGEIIGGSSDTARTGELFADDLRGAA